MKGNPVKPLQKISTLLGIVIVLPIWYYLLYKLLVATNASELQFFLFWIYLPISLFTASITRLYAKD